jgi:hypothetical protein
MKDLTNAFAQLKFNPEDYELLLPLVKKVKDAARTLKEDKYIESSHRMHQFQIIMREVTEGLHQSDLLSCLNEEKEDKKFWATVDLKALVQWKI